MTALPQPGIFANHSQFFLALEYRCANSAKLRSALAQIRRLAAAETFCVMAFGPALWRSLAPDKAPRGLRDFTAIEGVNGLGAPSTQADVLIWIHGADHSEVFDLGRAAHLALAPCAKLEREVPGFVYRDSRDLTGFIDGTANPKDDEALEAALVPQGEVGAGGACVLSQRFVHDLTAFNKLSVPEQERVIGRSKPDSVEMDKYVKPKDAHIARAEVEEAGVELKIFRRSFPFGGVTEHGLYFLAFARDPHRFEAILKNMYGVSGDGLHDHLLHFTRAVSGAYWFAPSAEELAAALA